MRLRRTTRTITRTRAAPLCARSTTRPPLSIKRPWRSITSRSRTIPPLKSRPRMYRFTVKVERSDRLRADDVVVRSTLDRTQKLALGTEEDIVVAALDLYSEAI